MEIIDRSKSDIYGDDIYLNFTYNVKELSVVSLIGEVELIGRKDDGWYIYIIKWDQEVVSFKLVMDRSNTATITFDDFGDYEITDMLIS